MTSRFKKITIISAVLIIILSLIAFSYELKNRKSEVALNEVDDTLAAKEYQTINCNDLLRTAEDEFNKKLYDQSILSSQSCILKCQEYGDIAFLNQVRCFLKINDKETARIILEKMKNVYPDSRFSKYTLEKIEKMHESQSIFDI